MENHLSSIEELIRALWLDYQMICPQADAITKIFEQRGDKVHTDHIAFRTFEDERVGLDVMGKYFTDLGYKECDQYVFKEKKLFAKYYIPPEVSLPKVFISELKLESFSNNFQETIQECLAQIPEQELNSSTFLHSGVLWKPLKHEQYLDLLKESDYGAWCSVFGFRANHFTVNINQLSSLNTIIELNDLIKSNGFELNQAGGEVKGSENVFLEQSSTLASKVNLSFEDGEYEIPGCYFEFAKRYLMPNGELFHGFIAPSADKIFESTNQR